MTMQPKELVDAYLAALTDRDYERARSFLADSGFEYTSPIATFADADAFMDYMMLIGGIIHAITCRKTFADGYQPARREVRTTTTSLEIPLTTMRYDATLSLVRGDDGPLPAEAPRWEVAGALARRIEDAVAAAGAGATVVEELPEGWYQVRVRRGEQVLYDRELTLGPGTKVDLSR